ncbi:ankyrin repeat-containing domain protein [Whalleya microplaca]|nr:ankyrin repeat-containing domain protein [Whalleya microplaca]
MGGILALLLGRLKLSVSECIIEYWKLSSTILRQESFGAEPPLFDAVKLRIVLDDIVRRYTSEGESPNLLTEEEDRPRTCAFAVRAAANEKTPHCFRTYEYDREDTLKMSSNISISDAAVTAIAAEGLFEEVTLPSASNEPIKFLDTSYPLGLINPTTLVLEEFIDLIHDYPIDVVSVGPGRVAFDDIGHLLQLGIPRPSSWSIISPVYRLLRVMYEKVRNLRESEDIKTITIDGELWSPEKVVEHLDNQYKESLQNVIHRVLQRTRLEGYRRLEIKPVPNTGPNDFLSLKEVSEAVDEYLKFVQLPSSSNAKRNNLTTIYPGTEAYSFNTMTWDGHEHTTVFGVAVQNGCWALVMLLGKIGVINFRLLSNTHWEHLLEYDRNIATGSIGGYPCLITAALYQNVELTGLLLDRGADIMVKDYRGKTALHHSTKGRDEVAKLLLDRGADIEIKDMQGKTALHCVTEGSNKLVTLLLDRDTDIKVKNNQGQIALHLTVDKGRDKIAKLLLNRDADITEKNN